MKAVNCSCFSNGVTGACLNVFKTTALCASDRMRKTFPASFHRCLFSCRNVWPLNWFVNVLVCLLFPTVDKPETKGELSFLSSPLPLFFFLFFILSTLTDPNTPAALPYRPLSCKTPGAGRSLLLQLLHSFCLHFLLTLELCAIRKRQCCSGGCVLVLLLVHSKSMVHIINCAL